MMLASDRYSVGQHVDAQRTPHEAESKSRRRRALKDATLALLRCAHETPAPVAGANMSAQREANEALELLGLYVMLRAFYDG